jgi:hypothetical protein
VNARALVVLCATLILTAGPRADTRDPSHRSAWCAGEIAIDGSLAEWTELASFAKDVPFSIGVRNDGEDLYVALSSSDPSVPSLLARRGLIIWFDAEGGTKKRFGIRYPVVEDSGGEAPARPGGSRGGSGGGGGGEPRSRPGRPPAGEGGPPGGPGASFDPTTDGRLARLEVIGPGKDDRRSLMLDHAPGLVVRIGRVEGTIVYELKVPLRMTTEHPYAIGAAPGKIIGIGLETPDVQGGGPHLGGLSMGMPGGGSQGGMGGGPPKGGGRPGGPEGGSAKPIRAWTTAGLAAEPAAAKDAAAGSRT